MLPPHKALLVPKPAFVPKGILLFVQSSLQQVGWSQVMVVVVPILVVVCLFVPFHTLVVCKLGLAEVVAVTSLLAGFCI